MIDVSDQGIQGDLMKGISLRSICLVLLSVLTVGACSGDPEVGSQDALARGDKLAAQGSFNEAIVEYRRAVQLAPRSGKARQKLGDAYFKNKNMDGALTELVAAADLLPTDIEAQLRASELSLLVGRFDDARGRAEKVLALDPKNIEAQIVKGNAMAGLKDVSGAIAQLEAAIRTDPSRGASYANLGGLQVAKGDLVAAEAALKKAVSLDSESVVARLALRTSIGPRIEAAAESLIKEALVRPEECAEPGTELPVFPSGGGRRGGPSECWQRGRHGPDASLALADYYIVTGGRRREGLAAEHGAGTTRTVRPAQSCALRRWAFGLGIAKKPIA
jgi:Flp pilus assembly protein TadD